METLSHMTEQAENTSEAQMPDASLDALLQGDPALQSQFDQKVSKALNTARNNWEKARGAETVRVTEQELDAREQALQMRERKADAVTALGKRGLPGELAQCLRYEDDESVLQSMDAVEKAFSAEVQKAVRERLTGTPPKGGAQPAYTSQMRAALGLR